MKRQSDEERARERARRSHRQPDPVVWGPKEWDRAIEGLKAVLERRDERRDK